MIAGGSSEVDECVIDGETEADERSGNQRINVVIS